MVLLVTAIALVVIGLELTETAWPRKAEHAPGVLERLTYACATGAALWIASTWVLALTKCLTEWILIARAGLLALAAIVLVMRRMRGSIVWRGRLDRNVVLAFVAVVPILVWSETMLWRGAIVPPLSHDALSYHLPKAVFFSRAHGFEYLKDLDPRQRNIPANYELILAEMVVTQHRDTYTEWPSVAFYLLFVLASGALAEQWTQKNLAAGLCAMVFAGATPVALLHSGAHKNDLLLAFTMVAGLVCAGRWLANKELAALRLLIAMLALGMGTKPQAATLAVCLMPFVLAPLLRPLRLRPLLTHSVFAVFAFVFLGGAVYLINYSHERSMMGTTPDAESVVTYGDWRNLWEGPYILLAAPFATSDTALSVPWEQEPYFWRKHEIFFSHLGIPFAICVLLLPVGIWVQRRSGISTRVQVSLAVLASFALMMPVVFRPHGMYAISLPRYVLFVIPVVFAWTLGPLAAAGRAWACGVWVVGVICLSLYGVDTLVNDRFAPLDYVLWARQHPGTRHIPFDSSRAASAVDRLAGPHDKIAFDATYASWIQPAFGADLTRPVVYIPEGSGPPVIPEDVKWVVIDRSWNIIWGGTGMKTLTEYQLLGRGQPTAQDLRVRRALLKDRRWRLVYWKAGLNQLVFERVSPGGRQPPASGR
jgi:hypothetical protein